ncbi:MAG: ABC transporter permease [Micropruina sp.]
MLNVTLEEKENRVTEMILTTMNPTTLIVGKVLALVLIGIVQGVVVAIPTAVVVSLLTGDLGGAAAPGVPVLGSIPFDAGAVAVGFALFLLSFLMFTGLLVAIGAVMPSAKEAGNTFGVMIMAMFIPLYAASLLVSDPHGPVSQIFTFFPLTAPVSALLRNATGGLDAWGGGPRAESFWAPSGWLFPDPGGAAVPHRVDQLRQPGEHSPRPARLVQALASTASLRYPYRRRNLRTIDEARQ